MLPLSGANKSNPRNDSVGDQPTRMRAKGKASSTATKTGLAAFRRIERLAVEQR
jgi:hypothetical protein